MQAEHQLERIIEEEVVSDELEEWKVEKILEKNYTQYETEYHVKWKGSNETTWEPKENMTKCETILENYNKYHSSFVEVKDLQKILLLPKLYLNQLIII